jgi:hypothetical protein
LFGETPDIVTEGLLRSQELPGRTKVPLKFPSNTFSKSFQLWICRGGRSSGHARAVSDRNRGSCRMMTRSSVAPPN